MLAGTVWMLGAEEECPSGGICNKHLQGPAQEDLIFREHDNSQDAERDAEHIGLKWICG